MDVTKEAQSEPKKRHPFQIKMLSVMGKQNPEADEYDEDELLNTADSKYSEMEGKIKGFEEANSKLAELILADPILKGIIEEMYKGAEFREAAAMFLAPEDLQPVEGEPDYEKYQTAAQKRTENYNKHKEFMGTIENNKQKFMKTVDDYIAAEGLSDEEADKFLQMLDMIVNKALTFDLSVDELKQFSKAMNYEKDVKMAEETGMAAGRMENMEVKKVKSDGLPDIQKSDMQIEQGAPKKSWADYVTKKA